jgi:Glycosyltransferases involved in cell wall biogenesis
MAVPRVSILMPVYNVAPYLREAMDSILTQTYHDFELIVLDDCSPDKSAEILDSYIDSRIVRYRGEYNAGLANVLNVGMKMARGEFIARMDSDDVSLPERLEKQVAYLDAHPDMDLCSCGMQLFGRETETWIRELDPEDVKITALFYSPILHASCVWRRLNFEKSGLGFNQDMVPAEDYDMWTRALVAGLQLVNIPDVLYKYRIHEEQATSNHENLVRKDLEVQRNYLSQVFPNLEQSAIDKFIDKDNLSLLELKSTIRELIKANQVDGFFDQNRLIYRIRKYYEAIIVQKLHAKFNMYLFCELSLRSRLKYLLK